MAGEVVGEVNSLAAGATVTIQPPSGESWQIEHINLTFDSGGDSQPLNGRNWIRLTDGTFTDGYIWGKDPANSEDRYQAPTMADVGGPKSGGAYSFDPIKIKDTWYLEMQNKDCQSRTYQYAGIKMRTP